MKMPAGSVKILKCKVCNKDVSVNSAYPITEVTCMDCYVASKNDKNVWGHITTSQGLILPPGGALLCTQGRVNYNYSTNTY